MRKSCSCSHSNLLSSFRDCDDGEISRNFSVTAHGEREKKIPASSLKRTLSKTINRAKVFERKGGNVTAHKILERFVPAPRIGRYEVLRRSWRNSIARSHFPALCANPDDSINSFS